MRTIFAILQASFLLFSLDLAAAARVRARGNQRQNINQPIKSQPVQPSAPLPVEEKLIVEAVPPDSNGVSTNEILSSGFSITPEIRASPDTRTVHLKSSSKQPFIIKNSHDIKIDRPNQNSERMLLIIEALHYIGIQNSTFTGVDVRFISNTVQFLGLGANATNSIDVRSPSTRFSGPIITDSLSIDGTVQVDSPVVARTARITNGGDSAVKSSLDVADRLDFSSNNLLVSGRVQGSKINLALKHLDITNTGRILGEQGYNDHERKISIACSDPIINRGIISSEADLLVIASALDNMNGVIRSKGDLTFCGDSESKPMSSIRSTSGQIVSSGKMRIFSNVLRLSPQEIPQIKSTPAATTRSSQPVNANCKGYISGFHNAEEITTIQSLPPYSPSLISAKGGIDFHVRLIENVLSRIETAGDVWLDESLSPNIVLDALYTRDSRQLSFINNYVSNPLSPQLGSYFSASYEAHRAANHNKNYRSYTVDFMRSLGCKEVSIQPLNKPSFPTHYVCTKAGDDDVTVFCQDQMTPHAASMVYGGTVFGKASSMKMRQWSLPANSKSWLETTSSDTSWRKEQITVKDQIIPILPNLEILNLLGTLKLPGPKTDGAWGKLWADGSGYNGLSSVVTTKDGASDIYLEPHIEYMAINYALSKHLGEFKITPHELLRNSAQMIHIYKLQAGQCPTATEIAAAEVPFLCSGWTTLVDGRQVLIPIAIVPKAMIAEWRSREAAQFEGDLIDLTVEGDARIDGAIRAIKEGLRLKAKNLVLTGLAEGKDVNFQADNSLLLQAVHDEITGHFKPTKIKSEGTIEVRSNDKLTSIATEMVGKNIVVRSEGQLAIIPFDILESFKEEFIDGGRVTIEGTCKKYFANIWQASEKLDISSAQDMHIKGGFFKADNIDLKSDQSNIHVEGLVEECRKLFDKKSGGFLWSEHIREETKTKDVVQTKFDAANKINIKSGKDTNLENVVVEAREATIKADGFVKLDGGKSSVKVDREEHSSCLLCFGKSGKFYIFGAEGETSNSYDEKVIKSSINSQKLDISAGEKVVFNGVDVTAHNGVIEGGSGVDWKSLTQQHSNSKSTYHSGLFVEITTNAGELSISINLGGGQSKEDGTISRQTSDELLATGHLKIDGKNGGVKLEGVNPSGNLQFAGQRLEMSGTKSQICFEGELWQSSIGLKLGAKSRLTKALADVFETSQTKVRIVEDSVNLGFEVLKNTVDLVTGILIPYEFGVWITGEAGIKKQHQCFQAVVNAKGNFFAADGFRALDVDVIEDILLNSVDFNAMSTRFKGRSFSINGASATATYSESSLGASGEVNVQGVGVPSASASAHMKQGSSTIHQTSKLNVDKKLEFDISGRAEFRGAQVKARELFANFGDLLLQSLQNTMQSSAAGGSLSIDPTRFDDVSKLLTGVGASGLSEKKTWIADITQLLGVNVAQVVVKNTITLVAAVIANADRDSNGKLTDKSNLELTAAKLIYRDVMSEHDRLGLGLNVARGPHRAIPGTVSGEFTYADKDEVTKATIGKGNIKIAENPEVLGGINRDVEHVQHTEGVEIQPIRFYVPIVSPENMGDLWAELRDDVNHPIDHVVRTFKRNLKAMTWFTDGKDWTPENDARWRHLLDRLRIVGEDAANAQDIKETESEIKEAKAEAVKNGDEKRQKELEVAEENLEQAKSFSALEKVFADEGEKSTVHRKAASLNRQKTLARAKRFAKPSHSNIEGKAKTPGLSPETASRFGVDRETTPVGRERSQFLANLYRSGYLTDPKIEAAIRQAIDISKALENAGDLKSASKVVSSSESWIDINHGLVKETPNVALEPDTLLIVAASEMKILGSKLLDYTLHNPRFMGGVQAVSGLAQTAGGIALAIGTSWTIVGLAVGGTVAVLGTDNFATGVQEVISGKHQDTLYNKPLQETGVSPEVAAYIELGTDLVTGVAGMHAAGRMAVANVPQVVLQNGLREASATVPASASRVVAETPFVIASNGGRHAGQLERFLAQTPDQLRKSIRSFEKNIAKHQEYIENPVSHAPDWNTFSRSHQEDLLHHWRKDIARAQEFKSIAQEVLNQKG